MLVIGTLLVYTRANLKRELVDIKWDLGSHLESMVNIACKNWRFDQKIAFSFDKTHLF